MNAILDVYTTLDEFTDLQCDYVDQVVKCECLEKELSKKPIKNDKAFKENQSNIFLKEHEQYFEIQDLKAQLQDKGIAISELKKLIEKMKGKSMETKTKMPMAMPTSTREYKRTVNQSVATPLKRTVALESTNQKPRHTTRKLYEHLIEIILFIVDSWCSKHMTGNLKLLSNFVEKFLDTVKFGNDQIALILGYGDLVQGNITIKRGSHGTDLYSITLQNTSTPNPICLMAKATSSQAWLWHHGENLDKMKEKGDACIFVGYSTQSRALNPGHQSQENVPQAAETVTTLNELGLLFGLMFNELLNGTTQVVSKSSAVTTADAPNQCQQHINASTSTIVAADTPSLNIQTTPATRSQAPT
ncbi:hypothetical protein Tco_1208962 [Tanacetum coccineum]